jgi:hypothetical protein
LIIRFDGPYFFFQPGRRPGSDAHQAKGSPLGVRIMSANDRPLLIEAHQRLSSPIPVARCYAMDVEIRNRDNVAGAIALAVLLRDTTQPRKEPLYLGERPIESMQPGQFVVKTKPVGETLRFAIPERRDFRKFDEITVMLLPDIEHALLGPKIAIEQFRLYPR